MSDTTDTETPSVTELHTKALDSIHAAIAAVQAFLGHPGVVDDTTLFQAAKHSDLQIHHALAAFQSVGVAQVVAATEPEPTDEPTAEEKQGAYAASRRTSARNTFQGQQAVE